MDNGERGHKLNFPDDYTGIYRGDANTRDRFSSKFIGVTYDKQQSKWRAQRQSTKEKKQFSNGCYDDEETAAHASDTLARKLMENEEQKIKLNFPANHTEVYPEQKNPPTSEYIGVSYCKHASKWHVHRSSENKRVSGGYYNNEETAAHASDTLARKLMAKGEQGHKLNFPDDDIEVFPEQKTNSSQCIGVSYNVKYGKWLAQRRSKLEKKMVFNGGYDSEETAAHASDTLARKLMANGKQFHKLNFPDNTIEVSLKEKSTSSGYIGVTYDGKNRSWFARRHSRYWKKMVCNGRYDNEETAAHASDTLARKLLANGEQNHKLNFPNNDTELHPKERQRKRKRPHHEEVDHPKNN
jgi:hypothetical protein